MNQREFICGRITITLTELEDNFINVKIVHTETYDYCYVQRIMESKIPTILNFEHYLQYGEYLSDTFKEPQDRWEIMEDIMKGFQT